MHLKKIISLCIISSVTSIYAGSVQLPQTGQTPTIPIIAPLSSGADGSLQKGIAWPNPRFTDGKTSTGAACALGQKTRVDGLTGLTWIQDLNAYTGNPGRQNWAAALTGVKNFNTATFCGYSDWRLPNRNELLSLVDYAEVNQATWLNNINSGGFVNVQPLKYWSSSSYAPNTIQAWAVDLALGSATKITKTSILQVWPVRGK